MKVTTNGKGDWYVTVTDNELAERLLSDSAPDGEEKGFYVMSFTPDRFWQNFEIKFRVRP